MEKETAIKPADYVWAIGVLVFVLLVFVPLSLWGTLVIWRNVKSSWEDLTEQDLYVNSNTSAYRQQTDEIARKAKLMADAVCESKGFDVGWPQIEAHSAYSSSTEDYYVASTTANTVCGYKIPDPSK